MNNPKIGHKRPGLGAAKAGELQGASFAGLDRFFERVRRHEARAVAVERAVHTLTVLGELDVRGARAFQLSLAALNNAYDCCDTPIVDARLLRNGMTALDLAWRHIHEAGKAAEGDKRLCVLHRSLRDAYDALRTHYIQAGRPMQNVGSHIDLKELARGLIVKTAQAAFEYYSKL